MKKHSTFIILLLFTLFIGIGEASFNLFDDNIINGNANNGMGTNIVTFDYNDGGLTSNYYYHFSSSQTKIKESNIPTPNVNESKHKFVGWFTKKSAFDNDIDSFKVDFSSHNFKDGDIIYAKYVSTISTSGTSVNDITPSSVTNPYYISASNYKEPLTLSSEINLYFDDNKGAYSNKNAATSSTNDSNAIRLVSGAKVYAVLDTDLIIENGGTLQLNATLGYKSKTNGFNQLISTNEYTALDLNGYTIKIKNGGTLNGYGIIFNSKNTGGIIVESGGTITTPYCIGDFKGGGYLTSSYHDGIMSFGSFICPYLSCETVFAAGSKLIGEASLNASSDKYTTSIPLIGSNTSSLINLSNGYIIRKATDYRSITMNRIIYSVNSWTMDDLFTPSSYREKLIFTNNVDDYLTSLDSNGFVPETECVAALTSLTLTLKMLFSISISMQYGDFPIPSFMDIEMHNTNFTFGVGLVSMPSSTIFIDANSIINMTNTYESNKKYYLFARIATLDEFPQDYYYINSAGTTKTLGSNWMQNVVTYSSTKAKIIINGKFTFNSSNVDMTKSYSCYSIGGYIDCSKQAIDSLIENQDYIDLVTRFYFPIWMVPASGKYSHSAGRYYTKPLISNGNVYMQIGNSNVIRQGYIYDDSISLYSYNNKVYYYKFTNEKFTSTIHGKETNSDAPSESALKQKFDMTSGGFTECLVNKNIDKTIKSSADSKYYAFVCGAYISLGTSVTQTNNKVAIEDPSNNKFSLTGFTNYKCASYITKDLYTDRWVFTI